MRKTMNKQQAAYIFHKANVENLRAQADRIELEYITANCIRNPDGSIPTKSWHIWDDKVFDTMLADTEDALIQLNIDKAEKALRIAEDELIRYGLGIMPKCYSNERQTLENACFGLNGYDRQYKIREQLIANTLMLDVSTVPTLRKIKGA